MKLVFAPLRLCEIISRKDAKPQRTGDKEEGSISAAFDCAKPFTNPFNKGNMTAFVLQYHE